MFLVVFHFIGCIAVLVTGLAMPVVVWKLWDSVWPGYGWMSIAVWIPLGTLLVQMTTDPLSNCILTNWENDLRKRLGKPRIETFVGHYFLRRK
jgi:hypothetical protein